MIIVIQCAATKRANAGHLQTQGGVPVMFVARPALAPKPNHILYSRPDDNLDNGQSWRDILREYNDAPGHNPMRLLPAYELYANDTYRRLVARFGQDKTFILSAGWGLINSSFLTPSYDITFSAMAEPYKRRKKGDQYSDFQMLAAAAEEEVVFLGGKDYVPQFCALTRHLANTRTIFYNSASPPVAPGCLLKRFDTTTRTNWHYECANRLLEGSLS